MKYWILAAAWMTPVALVVAGYQMLAVIVAIMLVAPTLEAVSCD